MSIYDVITVFGSQLDENGRFPDFVYEELTTAAHIADHQPDARFVFCGSHPMLPGLRDLPKECDVAEAFLKESFPDLQTRLLKEGQSTSMPENWLFLRLMLEEMGIVHPHILLVTIMPLMPRLQWLGQRIFGKFATLSFITL